MSDPGSAFVFPIYAKLHHPVTLPCETWCSGRATWSLDNNRDVVIARCDYISCSSEKEGYEMSHDHYIRGDLSLTITNPDYSMRETYTCECDYSDYATVRLRINPEFSAVQMQTEENLKLDLSVPESVEVIYRGSDSADDVQICTVTNRTLQCQSEYIPRTSLSNSELTLRDVQRSESGTYTIRNLDYKEGIRVYAVSVSGLTTIETAGIVIGLLLLVLVIAGVVFYTKRKIEKKRERKKEEADQKLRKLKSLMKAVDKHIKQAQHKPHVEVEAALQQVEMKIKELEQAYRGDSEYSEQVKSFCNKKTSEMELYRKLSTGMGSLPLVTGE
ncbi:CAP-Gly domain-containing linker protein 1-like isoform X1, partial [Clarias magur]